MKPEIKSGLLAAVLILAPVLLLFSDLFADHSPALITTRWVVLIGELVGGYILAKRITPELAFKKWAWYQYAVWVVLFVLGLIYFNASVREQGPKTEQKAQVALHMPRSGLA